MVVMKRHRDHWAVEFHEGPHNELVGMIRANNRAEVDLIADYEAGLIDDLPRRLNLADLAYWGIDTLMQ